MLRYLKMLFQLHKLYNVELHLKMIILYLIRVTRRKYRLLVLRLLRGVEIKTLLLSNMKQEDENKIFPLCIYLM
jgi:hypothetical protein